MYQGGALFSSMTLGENVALPLTEYTALKPDAIDRLVRLKLRQVGLEGFEHHLPEELSGGMKKRGAIARALTLDPDIIVADEPTSALDVTVQRRILDHLQGQIRALGTAMLFITHDLGLAAKRC